MDQSLLELQEKLAEVIENKNFFKIQNSTEWSSWSLQARSMLNQLTEFHAKLQRHAADPLRQRKYEAWKWEQVVKEIEAATPDSSLCTTNWNSLCKDTAILCIKKMDLETRNNLRLASRTERELVDKTKISLRRAKLELTRGITLTVDDGSVNKNEFSMLLLPWQTVFRNLVPILNTIDTVKVFSFHDKTKIGSDIDKDAIKLELANCSKFKCSKFESYCRIDHKISVCFLSACVKEVEKVKITNRIGITVYKEFIELPQVMNARLIKIAGGEIVDKDLNVFIDITQKWIENDAPVGKKVINHGRGAAVINVFAKRFEDRIISRTMVSQFIHDEKLTFDTIRLRMDDRNKHIMMQESDSSRPRRFCRIVEACHVTGTEIADSDDEIF